MRSIKYLDTESSMSLDGSHFLKMLRVYFLLFGLTTVYSLENGLARTPPMGWMSWKRFKCNIDCENDPDNCISEKLFMVMADRVVADGYKDVGYQYICVDDCWMTKERDSQGYLQVDPIRFPRGMKYLADYVHSKGLKFGLYAGYGTITCQNYSGSFDHMDIDSKTFAEWGVDYLKFDGCYSDPRSMDIGFPKMGEYLNKTGRPIVYSCGWPDFQVDDGIKPDYTSIAKHCNLWRNYLYIKDSWTSVLNITDYFSENQNDFIPYAGPGHWNDPDMLMIGNYGLSYEEAKAQMAIWAILAAPLIMSCDLRTIRDEFKDILQNKDVIAVDQDSLGVQGKLVFQRNFISVWLKPINPVIGNFNSHAIAFLSRRTDGMPFPFSVVFQDLGLNKSDGYFVRELYTQEVYGVIHPETKFEVKVNPCGVVFVRADVF